MTLVQIALHFYARTQCDRFGFVEGTPTQVFNAHGRKQKGPAPIGIVYVPGFASIPFLKPPGVLGKVAWEQGCDLVRFYHPEMLADPSQLSYSSMINQTADVIKAMPNRQVVIVASSFGAGLVPWAIKQVRQRDPDKIAGVFGWAAMTPKAVWDLINAQPDIDQLSPTRPLVVNAPTLPRPFTMTYGQYMGLSPYLDLPSNCRLEHDDDVRLLLGDQDPVAGEKQTLKLAEKLMPGEPACVPYKGGHRPPEDLIRQELSALIQRVQARTSRPVMYA